MADQDLVRANGELEIADLLRYIRQERIRNVVWITGDVHNAAAHHYDPQRAQLRQLRQVPQARGRSLLIVNKLEQFDYAGATAIGAVQLTASFLLLFAINGIQWWAARKTAGPENA